MSAARATEVVYTSDDLTPGSVEKSLPVMVYIHPTADVIITPQHTGEGSPGETLQYVHTIDNKGNIFDTFEITYNSSLGWTYEFYADLDGDGTYEKKLEDTDSDGIIDTGVIDHCCSIKVLKKVKIPPTASVGQVDTMVITVKSSLDPTVKDEATNTTKVIPPFVILGPPTPVPPPPAVPVKVERVGVLPFAGAVLLPLLLCGGMLIGTGISIFRRYRITIVPRR